MEKFHLNLDQFGLAIRERRIWMAGSIFFCLAFLLTLGFGFQAGGIYILVALLNGVLQLAAAAGCVMFLRGKNIYELPLETFFRIDDEKISCKFSVFSPVKYYCWKDVQKVETSSFLFHFWIEGSIHEIDLQDIRSRGQQKIIKQKLRTALESRNLLKQKAAAVA